VKSNNVRPATAERSARSEEFHAFRAVKRWLPELTKLSLGPIDAIGRYGGSGNRMPPIRRSRGWRPMTLIKEDRQMPTYVCSVLENSVDDSQKGTIAEAIARIHSEVTGAPIFFCQTVIEEKKPTDRFLGPTRASSQIWIRGDIRAGRTETQRTQMMLRMMEEVSRIATVRKEEIWVYICNLTPTDMVEYGHVLPKPGEETAWFDALPKSLQDHMRKLGTSRENFTL
jgi:phenylpyruvate tautomerase PptA (4-oxalocrotonate tautomerase family)